MTLDSFSLSHVPALRLLAPFVLGIILATWLPGPIPIIAMAGLGLVMMVVMTHWANNPLQQFRLRHWWWLPLSVMSLAAGALSLELYRPRPLDLQQVNGHTASALVEHIDTYDFGMRLQVRLLALNDHDVPPRRMLLSTRGCDYALHEGDVIGFRASMSPVTNLGDPDEFDRQNHLWQQGILYSQHLPVSQLHHLGHRPTLLSLASSCRRYLVSHVLSTSLSPQAQDLMIALLLGNSRQIDNNVRHRFSQAGIAHILALSGLHVGLITTLIWFILFPLDYLRLKKLRLIITLVTLLAFAVLTGLSPSVVRATIMIGFTLTAIVLYRKSVALNAMCMAALTTLCIWPTAIYQAGFQLSYITVAAIVGLQGIVSPGIDRKQRMLQWLWSLVSTSLIAMAATIMLSAYYFNSITLLSVLSNVLILPVMPVLMTLGVIFMFLASIGLEWNLLNGCIEVIYGYMNHVSTFISSMPGAHISGVFVTGLTVCLFYMVLGFLVVWGFKRHGKWLVATLAAMVLLVGQLVWLRFSTPSSGLMVLNDYRATPILWHENGHGYAWLPDDPSPDRELFEQTHRRLLAHLNVDSLKWVVDNMQTDLSAVHGQFAMIQGHRILAVGKHMTNKWLEQTGDLGDYDLLIMTKRYHGQLSDIMKHCTCKLVLLSGDLPEDRHKSHLEACRQLQLPCHDLKKGAYLSMPIK